VRAALVSSVYRKSLRLGTAARNKRTQVRPARAPTGPVR